MMEFLLGGSILLITVMAIIQFSLLWAGQGAVETAAHLAARKFALLARKDFQKAKAAALAEASSLCLHRPGGKWSSTRITSIDFSPLAGRSPTHHAPTGEAYRLLLTHWIELAVPWVNKILFSLIPGKKARIGNQYFLLLQATRWVTVE